MISATTLSSARRYRKARLLAQPADHQQPAIVLFDPINIHYSTDVSNMQVWTAHSPGRYPIVCADGYTVAFEFGGSEHLDRSAPGVDETRTAQNWFYFAAGERMVGGADKWVAEITDVVRERMGSVQHLEEYQ